MLWAREEAFFKRGVLKPSSASARRSTAIPGLGESQPRHRRFGHGREISASSMATALALVVWARLSPALARESRQCRASGFGRAKSGVFTGDLSR
jgi:hypothetical protein